MFASPFSSCALHVRPSAYALARPAPFGLPLVYCCSASLLLRLAAVSRAAYPGGLPPPLDPPLSASGACGRRSVGGVVRGSGCPPGAAARKYRCFPLLPACSAASHLLLSCRRRPILLAVAVFAVSWNHYEALPCARPGPGGTVAA
eukprot:189255-Alexandrium_andersonii.AAC.1